jgi:Sec-independent protein translocase protein TatA
VHFLTDSVVTFGLILGGGEFILIIALMLILVWGKRLGGMARGFGRGISEFGGAIDREARDAGESVGGIYGKPAAEALTPENLTGELYDPAALRGEGGRPSGIMLIWRRLLSRIRSLLTDLMR